MSSPSIYDNCPTYSSDHFLLRLVAPGDAEDLLCCYSNAVSVRLMNADNCTSDFHYSTLDEIDDCIRGWLNGYQRHIIVRFSIVDTRNGKAIGTVEMYRKTKDVGILRLDLRSEYESQSHILELLELSVESFYAAFGVQQILTKAIPAAAERISALRARGFVPAEHHAMKPHGDYYSHIKC